MAFLFVLFFGALIIALTILMRIDLFFHYLTKEKDEDEDDNPDGPTPSPPKE